MSFNSENLAKLDISALRSQRWYAPDTIRAFAHRQRSQQSGLNRDEFMGKPVIGIINTWSEMSPCHSHLRERAEAVKRAVWAAGATPLNCPRCRSGKYWSSRPPCSIATFWRWRQKSCCASIRSMGPCCSAVATNPRQPC